MPTIYIIYAYIVYITSNDAGEPFHVHVVSKEYEDSSREMHSAKIWLGKFGEAEIASNKGHIKQQRLEMILREIRKRQDIYDKAVSVWCKFFGIKPDQIDYYRNFSNGGGAGLGGGRK